MKRKYGPSWEELGDEQQYQALLSSDYFWGVNAVVVIRALVMTTDSVVGPMLAALAIPAILHVLINHIIISLPRLCSHALLRAQPFKDSRMQPGWAGPCAEGWPQSSCPLCWPAASASPSGSRVTCLSIMALFRCAYSVMHVHIARSKTPCARPFQPLVCHISRIPLL
jgi:hypothetical protein